MAIRKGYRRRRGGRKAPTVRRAVRKAVKTVQKARMRAVIKEVLGRQVETKIVQYGGSLQAYSISSGLSQAQFNAACLMVSPQGATIPAIGQGYPVIGNGVGQDQRIGDEIKIKGIYLNYLATALGYDATTNANPKSFLMTIWVIQPKTAAATGLLVTNIQGGSLNTASNFFENQNNADSGLNGTTLDLLRKVDKDNYKVLAVRTHKLGFAGNLNTSNVVSTFQNNDFNQFVRGRIKLKGWNMKFSRQEYQQRLPIFMFCSCMAADGSPYAVNALPASFVFNETIYYSDM